MKFLPLLGILLSFCTVQSAVNQSNNIRVNNKWIIKFSESNVTVHMDEKMNLTLTITGLDLLPSEKNMKFQLKSELTHLVDVDNRIIQPTLNESNMGSENFTIYGKFLGDTKIYLELINDNNKTERLEGNLNVIIIRATRVIDHIFTGSVILLVSLLYINFGAALDFTIMKGILRRPIGPVIGFCGQFIVMPVTSYVFGLLLFPEKHMAAFRLGLFFTGISPAGGASNIWTVILGGNINLSILMTTISTFAAFGMMPLWLFTLGHEIFESANITVPYDRIASFAIGLVIPLFIGIGIQKYLPRIGKILIRLLKPISVLLILFIIIFAIVTNLYLFELFSWQIVLAGLGLPWLGYLLSWCVAKLLKQNGPDSLAIAIETGIQNTGIAIFLLRLTLKQPYADLTTVMPVSVAIMTPIPLFTLFICKKIWNRYHPSEPARIETQSIIKSDIS